MATVEQTGWGEFRAIVEHAASLSEEDLEPLGERWERTLVEANRKARFEGIDGNGNPMAPVTYRPISGEVKRRKLQARKGNKFGATDGEYEGFGPYQQGLNNNLSWGEYRQLDGPELIPRGNDSRLITNFATKSYMSQDGSYAAIGEWHDVVDVEGRPFLMDHFEGHGVKRRDARGLTPWGSDRAQRELDAFARGIFQP